MRQKTSAKEINYAERRERILALRQRGYTYQAIAKEIGTCDAPYAYRVVAKYIEKCKEKTQETAQELLQLELERLDTLFRTWFPRACGGRMTDGTVLQPDPKAAKICMDVIERRAKFLGIDSPLRTEITGKDGGPIETREVEPLDLSEIPEEERERFLDYLRVALNRPS